VTIRDYQLVENRKKEKSYVIHKMGPETPRSSWIETTQISQLDKIRGGFEILLMITHCTGGKKTRKSAAILIQRTRKKKITKGGREMKGGIRDDQMDPLL